MSQKKSLEDQLAEIDDLIAAYQKKSQILQVEILKLELKKEKLQDKIIFQQLKAKPVQSNLPMLSLGARRDGGSIDEVRGRPVLS